MQARHAAVADRKHGTEAAKKPRPDNNNSGACRWSTGKLSAHEAQYAAGATATADRSPRLGEALPHGDIMGQGKNRPWSWAATDEAHGWTGASSKTTTKTTEPEQGRSAPIPAELTRRQTHEHQPYGRFGMWKMQAACRSCMAPPCGISTGKPLRRLVARALAKYFFSCLRTLTRAAVAVCSAGGGQLRALSHATPLGPSGPWRGSTSASGGPVSAAGMAGVAHAPSRPEVSAFCCATAAPPTPSRRLLFCCSTDGPLTDTLSMAHQFYGRPSS